MKHIMMHDVSRAYFDLGLSQYRLTFDDGLFSQYYYYPEFSRLGTPLYYFITTSFIRPGGVRPMFEGRHLAYKKSGLYMYDAFIRDRFDHFMTTEEVRCLARFDDVRIGAHSHLHDVILTRTRPSKAKPASRWKTERFQNLPAGFEQEFALRSRLAFQGYRLENGRAVRRTEKEWEDDIKADTERSLEWFKVNLDLQPDRYCFPFNEYSEKLIAILKTYGFKTFYGARAKGRADIIERADVDRLVAPKNSLSS